MRAENRVFDYLAGEAAANNTLDDDWLAYFDLSTSVMNCQTTADSRACGRAINFAFGKDTNVSAMRSCLLRLVDKDGSIQKTQIIFEWMNNRMRIHHRALDGHAFFDQRSEIVRGAGKTDISRLDVSIKRPAIRQIIS